MKTIQRSFFIWLLALGLAGSAHAVPPGKGAFPAVDSQDRISALKKGDHYALVCLECRSVEIKEVESDDEGAKLCHDGGKLHCASCKKEVTIKQVGPAAKRGSVKRVTYVNAEGKECMFLVPLKK